MSSSDLNNRSKTLLPLGTIINKHNNPSTNITPVKPPQTTQATNFNHLKSAMFKTSDPMQFNQTTSSAMDRSFQLLPTSNAPTNI